MISAVGGVAGKSPAVQINHQIAVNHSVGMPLAPEGRQSIARGASPWKSVNTSQSPVRAKLYVGPSVAPPGLFCSLFQVQGHTPLAIDFRPYRGLANSFGINFGIHDVESLFHSTLDTSFICNRFIEIQQHARHGGPGGKLGGCGRGR